MFSELTQSRLKKFRGTKRAYYSLMLLTLLFILSLFSDILVNQKPLYISYGGKSYFPSLFFYPATSFGLKLKTEADYVLLCKDPHFLNKADSLIRAPLSVGPTYLYLEQEGYPPFAPSKAHWLGSDNSGRDVLARLIYGFRNCMVFALVFVLVSSVLGIIVGGVQGFFGGWVDMGCQRLIEIWSALPFLYVVIFLGARFGRSYGVLLLCLSLFSWIGLSYYMRGEFLRLRNFNFVRAGQAIGLSSFSLIFRHILPNALTPIVTFLPFNLIAGISSLTTLDFLGFGVPPPSPSWGELLSQGLENYNAPWIAVSTVSALFITLLMSAFIGEGLREAFDPKAEEGD